MAASPELSLDGRGRKGVRHLKRLARAGREVDAAPALKLQGQTIALALLDRSIKFKHRRLALLRLIAAVETGALLSVEHWTYCKGVLPMEQDCALRATVKRLATGSTMTSVHG